MSAGDSAPGLDLGALDRLLRIGGQEFVVEMIELFLEHAPQRLATARSAFDAGDLTTVYRAAHSLKSTAANLGARALQSSAEEAEGRAAAEDAAALPPLLDGMETHYERIRTQLQTERDRRKSAST